MTDITRRQLLVGAAAGSAALASAACAGTQPVPGRTVPIGAAAEIDADAGTIELLEPAVL